MGFKPDSHGQLWCSVLVAGSLPLELTSARKRWGCYPPEQPRHGCEAAAGTRTCLPRIRQLEPALPPRVRPSEQSLLAWCRRWGSESELILPTKRLPWFVCGLFYISRQSSRGFERSSGGDEIKDQEDSTGAVKIEWLLFFKWAGPYERKPIPNKSQTRDWG